MLHVSKTLRIEHSKTACINSSALNSASLVSGAAAWKDRPGHFLVFILFWATFVYDPIARWTWSPDGWAKKWGVLDFAGGTAVHINAGTTTLAHCVFHLSVLPLVESFLSRLFGVNDAPHTNGVNGVMIPLNPPQNPPAHQRPPEDTEFYNLPNVVLGTLLLWIGWFGFNGGSALGANLRAVSACVSTHLAACSGGVTLAAYASQRLVARHAEHRCRTRHRWAGRNADDWGFCTRATGGAGWRQWWGACQRRLGRALEAVIVSVILPIMRLSCIQHL